MFETFLAVFLALFVGVIGFLINAWSIFQASFSGVG